tara:strand:- start:1680 stop:2039 length:360 start_codon:yes stop_codon:yes gene_type:complete
MCDAFVDAIDADASGGYWRIFNSASIASVGVALASLRFASTAFGAASLGIATAFSITQDSSATNSGTAKHMRVYEGDGTSELYQGDVSTSGADLNLNTVTISQGDVVSITSATVTMPAS